MVAELARVLQRAKVHRHGGAQGHALDLFAAFDHVVAQRAGSGGHQHIVDRAAAGAAHGLDLFQIQRRRPGHALAHAELAAQQRRRIVRQRQRVHQFAGDIAALFRQHAGQCRVAIHVHALFEHFRAELGVALHRADAARDLGAILLQPGLAQIRALAGLAGGVGERQEHLHQGDAVGIAVVDARNQRRATVIFLDQMELPERLGLVERAGGERADEALQRLLVGATGQRGQSHVPVQVEVFIGLPGHAAGGFDGFHPETRVVEEAFLDDLLQPRQRDRLVEHQHAGDHHRIGRPFHPQPCGIDARHRFAALALRCRLGCSGLLFCHGALPGSSRVNHAGQPGSTRTAINTRRSTHSASPPILRYASNAASRPRARSTIGCRG